MKKETAITILQEYNQWRRGENMMISMPNTKDIGEALDEAIKVLKESISEDTKPEPEHKSGWYVINDPKWEKYISYENLQDGVRYGLSSAGGWFAGRTGVIDWSCMIPATGDQIHTKIGNYIRSKGYREGTRVRSMVTGRQHTLDHHGLEFDNWSKCIKFGGVTIMKNGEWTEIIQAPSKEIDRDNAGDYLVTITKNLGLIPIEDEVRETFKKELKSQYTFEELLTFIFEYKGDTSKLFKDEN